jgi:hypothetical protein
LLSIVPVVPFPPATPLTDHFTLLVETPETVAVKVCVAPARTVAVGGLTATPSLFGPTTWALSVAEEIKPGLGFCTMTATVPTWVLVAVPEAVNCVGEIRVAVRAEDPNKTFAPGAKFAPFKVMLKEPTGMEVCERDIN